MLIDRNEVVIRQHLIDGQPRATGQVTAGIPSVCVRVGTKAGEFLGARGDIFSSVRRYRLH
jgi:hypothetical protein